jgi:tetratricopeptide (TPR) repeat protein
MTAGAAWPGADEDAYFARSEELSTTLTQLTDAREQWEAHRDALFGDAAAWSGRAAEAAAAEVDSHTRAMDALQRCLRVAADQADEAIKVLTQVTQSDPEDGEAFQYLAMAYDKKGNVPQSQLAAAQGFFLNGRYIEARTQADRAQRQFAEGSPGWLKADDILNYRPPKF